MLDYLQRQRIILGSLYLIHKNKQKIFAETELRLYGNRIEVGSETAPDYTFSFDETGIVTVLGKNKINLYFGEKLYQFQGSKRFNALKYVHFFHRYKQGKAGENNEFLGL